MNLSGKKVVVTGASGVLGKAARDKVIELGGTPILVDLAFAKSDTTYLQYAVDLTDLDATRKAWRDIGNFDAIFNIAGGFSMGDSSYEISEQDWEFMFKINVSTLHNALRASIPMLTEEGGGSIVNVGAANAVRGLPLMSAYCASKSTVMRLTESLSEEVKSQNINVNAVLPTIIDTPRNRVNMPDADYSSWVPPEKLSAVMCFLASEDASAIHGALLPVTGLA